MIINFIITITLINVIWMIKYKFYKIKKVQMKGMFGLILLNDNKSLTISQFPFSTALYNGGIWTFKLKFHLKKTYFWNEIQKLFENFI